MSLFFSRSLLAADDGATQQIADLLNSNQVQEAYSLASNLQSEQEGDPEFDYLFALAARATGELSQAVFALERVLQNQPNLIDARLVLAVCYYELGNLDASQAELAKLQDHPQASQSVQNEVSRYLQSISQLRQKQQQRWRMSALVGLGYDSNPNNGVADEFIDIPTLGRFALFEESLENASSYLDLQGQATYTKAYSQHTNLYFSASLVHTEYQDQFALDRTFAAGLVGVQSKVGEYNLSGDVFIRPLWLDGDSLLHYFGTSATLSRQLTPTYEGGAEVIFSREDYQDQQGFDRDLGMLKIWLQTANNSGTHRLALQVGEERASDDRDFLDRELSGLSYRWEKQLQPAWQAKFKLDYLTSDYQGVNTLFGTTRDDKFINAELAVNYAYSNTITLTGRMTYLSNDSEIPIYEYQRYKLWLGASYAF